MQVITIVQTKGGSGTTTTAMLLASAALHLGRRVTLIDGDVNAQLGRWRDSFELAAWEGAQKPDWPESLAILSPPETVEGLLSVRHSYRHRGLLPDLRSGADPRAPRLRRMGNDPSRRPLDGRPPRLDCCRRAVSGGPGPGHGCRAEDHRRRDPG